MEENTNIMELFSKVVILMHRFQHHQGGRGRGMVQNPHRGQGRILTALKMQPEISQKDLSYLLDMSNQSLSELLGKLEKSGFIERTHSETDRRVMNVKLTNSGADAANQAEKQKRDGEELFDCLTEEERKSLVESLKKIIVEFENQIGGEQDFGGLGFGDPREGMTPEMVANLQAQGFFHGRDFGRRGFKGFGMRGKQGRPQRHENFEDGENNNDPHKN